MNTLIFDLETDGLLPSMTTIWSCGIGDPATGKITTYTDYDPAYPSLQEGLDLLRAADRVVAHNLIGFDYWALEQLYPGTLMFDQLWDSIVVAALMEPERRSHAIKAYGQEFGAEKGDFTNFRMEPEPGKSRAQQFAEMFEYMERDVEINMRIYKRLQDQMKKDLVHDKVDWRPSILNEHQTNWALALQQQHGFKLDLDKARELEGTLTEESVLLDRGMGDTFPPQIIPDGATWDHNQHRWANIKVADPKVQNKTRGITKGAPYTKIKCEVFNAGSRAQIVRRLTAKYPAWKPSKFTPTGMPQIDESVLANLRVPEAEPLKRLFRVEKQLSQLASGKNAWLKLEQDGYVHGRVKSVGCRTHRMSHFNPNMGQVDKKDLRMREVWVPDPGQQLVGCDASGLELRMLAHYLAIWDGGEYAEAVISGSAADGTDAHTRTQKLAGLHSRNSAKTLIYAFLYGAGNMKLAEVHAADAKAAGVKPMAITHSNGKRIRESLLKGIVGLDKLIEVCQDRDKKQKWLKGLDGRKIATNGQHSALNTLLQGAGAVVMKKATNQFHFCILPQLNLVDARHMPVGWNYCATVHDEVQLTANPDIAQALGQAYADAITAAGEHLNLRCRLDGEFAVGDSWAATH